MEMSTRHIYLAKHHIKCFKKRIIELQRDSLQIFKAFQDVKNWNVKLTISRLFNTKGIQIRMYVALFSCVSKSGRNQACFITLSSKSKSLFGCQNLGPFISQPYLGPDMVIIHIRRCASSSSLPAPLHLMQVGPQSSEF